MYKSNTDCVHESVTILMLDIFFIKEQLNAANDALLERKKLQTEQDKILELRVLEYQREKAEREAAYEREQVECMTDSYCFILLGVTV